MGNFRQIKYWLLQTKNARPTRTIQYVKMGNFRQIKYWLLHISAGSNVLPIQLF